MNKEVITSIFMLATLLITCSSVDLEAKTKARFGFGFSRGYTTAQPVYVAPRVQPVYVYPSYPTAYPVIYEVPVYQPTYVYPQATRSSGFSFSWSNFWH